MTSKEIKARSLTFGAIGLGAGLIVGFSVLVHHARAEHARWQYTCFEAADARIMNDLGSQGWHLLPPRPDQRYCFERRY
jgi:hypothetical protein